MAAKSAPQMGEKWVVTLADMTADESVELWAATKADSVVTKVER